MQLRKLAALAGMVGPAVFVAVFTLEGLVRPGYQAHSMFISELSLGPRGWTQIANFVFLGSLFLVFTWGVAAEFQKGKASRFGPILLTIIGIGFLVSGPLVMDPVATPLNRVTVHGTLHGIFGALVFSLIPVTCFVFLRRFRADPPWHWLQRWTLAAGITTTAALVLLTAATKPPLAPNSLTEWDGLIQRALIVPFLAWVIIFAWGLRQKK